MEGTTGLRFAQIRGVHLYPPGGYMGWHTNSDVPGKRAYLTYAEQDNQSYFKFISNGKVRTSWDRKGWQVRMFEPKREHNQLLWHCVRAVKCNRISIGLLFK